MNSKYIAIIAAVVAGSETALNAQTVFSDLGMTDSSIYTVNASALNANPFDYQANFGLSYTSALGVPQDPFSSSTTALQLKINETSVNQAGVSVSPTSLSFSGPFSLTFDMWINYNSGGFTTGSTQVGSFGLTPANNKVQWAGVGTGQLFGILTDNGSATYYRGYNGGASIGATPFGGSQSYTSHATDFPSVDVPAGETTLDANQYGSTVAGTLGFQWLQVAVNYDGNILAETINGIPIGSYAIDSSSIGSDIFLGMYDFNSGSAGVSGLDDQNYTLFNNVNLTTPAPEPTTCALAALGGVGFLLARRRANARK